MSDRRPDPPTIRGLPQWLQYGDCCQSCCRDWWMGQSYTCATLPLIDKNTWCFRRLCEQQPNGWYHFREAMVVRLLKLKQAVP